MMVILSRDCYTYSTDVYRMLHDWRYFVNILRYLLETYLSDAELIINNFEML